MARKATAALLLLCAFGGTLAAVEIKPAANAQTTFYYDSADTATVPIGKLFTALDGKTLVYPDCTISGVAVGKGVPAADANGDIKLTKVKGTDTVKLPAGSPYTWTCSYTSTATPPVTTTITPAPPALTVKDEVEFKVLKAAISEVVANKDGTPVDLSKVLTAQYHGVPRDIICTVPKVGGTMDFTIKAGKPSVYTFPIVALTNVNCKVVLDKTTPDFVPNPAFTVEIKNLPAIQLADMTFPAMGKNGFSGKLGLASGKIFATYKGAAIPITCTVTLPLQTGQATRSTYSVTGDKYVTFLTGVNDISCTVTAPTGAAGGATKTAKVTITA